MPFIYVSKATSGYDIYVWRGPAKASLVWTGQMAHFLQFMIDLLKKKSTVVAWFSKEPCSFSNVIDLFIWTVDAKLHDDDNTL